MSRQSTNQIKNGKLYNGYDYENQAWVQNGKYVRCGHPEEMDCGCYGRLYEGEEVKDQGMTEEVLRVTVKEILSSIKKKSFVSDYQATDEEAMGMLISKYFEWDGGKIMKAASYACEDANFHPEAAVINKMSQVA